MLGRIKFAKIRHQIMFLRQRENATRKIQSNYRMHVGYQQVKGRRQVIVNPQNQQLKLDTQN